MKKFEKEREAAYKMKKHKEKIKTAKSTIPRTSTISNKKLKKSFQKPNTRPQTFNPSTHMLNQSQKKPSTSAHHQQVPEKQKLSDIIMQYVYNKNTTTPEKINNMDIICKESSPSKLLKTADSQKNERYMNVQNEINLGVSVFEDKILSSGQSKRDVSSKVNSRPISTIKNSLIASRTKGKNKYCSKNVGNNMISEFTVDEKKDLDQIPLFLFLKQYNLQQYVKRLVSEGFGYDLRILAHLTETQKEDLLNRIKFIPGHKSRFQEALDKLIEIYPNKKKNKSESKKKSETKSFSEEIKKTIKKYETEIKKEKKS